MRYKLGEICDIYDGPHATPPETDDGPIFLGIKNINEQCELDFTDVKHLSEDDYRKWTKRVTPQENDIVFSYEATLNRYALIPKGFNGCLGRRLAIARVKDVNVVNPHYLYHYFRSPGWNAFILANKVVGSTVLRVSVENFPDYEVELPDIETQRRIASVLDSISDKRDNNSEICNTLEAMAKLIYDYWFLQFEFPNEEGKPYKSSGGKMVYNEELKREIPEGWEVKRLKELLKINKKEFVGQNAKTIDLSVMPSDSIALGELNNSDNFDTNLFRMDKGDILFGSIRPYLHKAGIAPCDGAVAGTIHDFSPKNGYDYNYCLVTLCHRNMFDYAVNNSKGTKMPVIDTERLLDYPVPYSTPIVTKYNQIDICSTICHKVMENRQLASLRDWLLPMLMNGQITFKEMR